MRLIILCGFLIALLLPLQAKAEPLSAQTYAQALETFAANEVSVALTDEQEISFEQLTAKLHQFRVVHVGEYHPRYQDHLVQLALLDAMYRQNPNMAIGVEWFQQPFQPWLDAYIHGLIDETSLLQRTEYFTRWRVDFRQLRPILQYAREHGIRILALNAPTELTRQISSLGRDRLSTLQKQRMPEITPPSQAQRERLLMVFEGKIPPQRDVEDFIYAQRVWDETMAENVVTYLQNHPDHRLILFAGNFHIAWGEAIPNDMQRRMAELEHQQITVSTGSFTDFKTDYVDYFVFMDKIELQPHGRLGIGLDLDKENLAQVSQVSDLSAADLAGLQVGDQIIAINEQIISNPQSLLLYLLDTQPEQSVQLRLQRDKNIIELELELDP